MGNSLNRQAGQGAITDKSSQENPGSSEGAAGVYISEGQNHLIGQLLESETHKRRFLFILNQLASY